MTFLTSSYKMRNFSITLLTCVVISITLMRPNSFAAEGKESPQSSPAEDIDAALRLEELTDANNAQLLLRPGARSVIVAYSSLERRAEQQEQLTMVLRVSRTYAGAIGFYRLDQAKYPATWRNITNGRVWSNGPYYLLVNTSPQMIGTVVDTRDGVDTPVHLISQSRLNAEIFRFFKVRIPVSHVNVTTVDTVIAAPGLPTFMMVYRSKSAQSDPVEFQRFNYESQLYAGRVNFVMVDLDESDISSKLGIKLPQSNETYFVVYNPIKRDGSLIFDPLLTVQGMEKAIRIAFGPGHEPALVIK